MSTGGWVPSTNLPILPTPYSYLLPSGGYEVAGLNPSVWDVVDISTSFWWQQPTSLPTPLTPYYYNVPTLFEQVVVETLDYVDVNIAPWLFIDPGVTLVPYLYRQPQVFAQISPLDFVEPTYDQASMVWWKDSVLTLPIIFTHRFEAFYYPNIGYPNDIQPIHGSARPLYRSTDRLLRSGQSLIPERSLHG